MTEEESIGPMPLNPNEAGQLGLSNTEWLRARHTGDLPPDAQGLLARRFRDQTASTEDQSRRTQLPQEVGPHFPDEKVYALWSLDRLAEIHHQVESLRGASGDASSLVQAVYKWTVTTRPFLMELSHDDRLLSATAALSAELDALLAETAGAGQSIARRANLIDVQAMLVDVTGRDESELEAQLQQAAAAGQFELLGQLLDRMTPAGNLAFRALVDTDSSTPSTVERSVKRAQALTGPLLGRIEQIIARRGLESAATVIDYLDRRLIQAIQRTPKAEEQLVLNGWDWHQIAAQFFAALDQETDRIAGGYPSHYLTSVILDTLLNLYSDPAGLARKSAPDGLLRFLQILYREKVRAYSIPSQTHYLHDGFVKLADDLGIDPEIITKA